MAMKLLSIHIARSIWLLPINYLNPSGRQIVPAVKEIIDRYSFLETTPLTEVFGSEKKSLELKIGTFIKKDGVPIEVSLAIHNDGLVADTRSSTEDSDLFLEDVLTFLSDNFDMAPYSELPINKMYLSEIYFTLNQTPEFFSKLTNSFIKKSSNYINHDKVGNFEFMGIHLATDPELSRNPLFIRVEREVNVPFDENRFFSIGPIKTSEHIELLEGLETE